MRRAGWLALVLILTLLAPLPASAMQSMPVAEWSGLDACQPGIFRPASSVPARLETHGRSTSLYVYSGGTRRAIVTMPVKQLSGIFDKFVAVSPDGRKVTFATEIGPSSDEMKVWTVDIDGHNLRVIADIPHELWVTTPVWSPDSCRIAYVRTQSPGYAPRLELWVMNADGSSNHRLLAAPSFNTDLFYGPVPQPLRWSQYGIEYLDYGHDTVYRVSPDNGRLTWWRQALNSPGPGIGIVQTPYPIPVLSQNDPRWRYYRFTVCNASMGSQGCALTDVTMTFRAYGLWYDPQTLAQHLGPSACPLYWAYARDHGAKQRLTLTMRPGWDWQFLQSSLWAGHPALVWLSNREWTLGHWVLAVGGSGSSPSGYRIYDPWDGTTYKTLGYYTARGYSPMRVYTYTPR